MAQRPAPSLRAGIAASKLRAPTRTSYYNSFFLLRTEVILNGQPAEIGCSGDSELTLCCRYFPVPGEYSTRKPSISYPSISVKVEDILKENGIFDIGNFFCEDAPLFQVTFSSEYSLKQFLRKKAKVEKELAALFSQKLLEPTQQAGTQAIHIPTQVKATLFLMSPDAVTKTCPKPIEVTLANHCTCMAVWKESEVFDFGDVFRVFRLDPAKLPDEGKLRLSTVLSEISAVPEWVGLGLHLGIEKHQLSAISQDHWNQTEPCKQSMLDLWQRLGKASWSALVRGLCGIGRISLAKKIALKYGATVPPVVFRSEQKLPSPEEQKVPFSPPDQPKMPSQQQSPLQNRLLSSIECNDHLLEEKTTTAEKAAESKSKASEEYHLVKRHLSAALSNVDKLHKDKMTLSKQLACREKALRALHGLLRKQRDLGDPITLLEQDIQQLKEQLKQKDKEIAEKTAEAKNLNSKLQQATDELESAFKKLDMLKTEQESLNSDLERERRELEKEQYKSMCKDDTIKELKGDLSTVRAEASSKAEQTGVVKERLSSQSEEVERLRKALHEAEQRKPALPEQPSAAAAAATVQQQLLHTMETSELRVELATAEEGRQEVERQLGALQRQMQLLQDEIQGKQQKTLQLPTSFEWRRCRDLPTGVIGATTVVMNGKVYLGCTTLGAQHVLEYTPENDEWVELPKPPVVGFGLAVLNNQLVLVGGQEPSNRKRTNKLTVFDPSTRQWVHPYPPMATARSYPTAIAYQHYLIVAGGEEEDRNKSISVVEIFDSVKEHWYTAEELPIKCDNMTPVIISNTAYLLGGYIDDIQTKTVLTVSLPALINKATSQSQEVNTTTSWKVLPDSPLYRSVPFTSHNMLLTAGGQYDSGEDSSHIYCYDPVTSQWEKVGDLPEPRWGCSCTVLPSTELLVVGGELYWDSVYKATIQWK